MHVEDALTIELHMHVQVSIIRHKYKTIDTPKIESTLIKKSKIEN
jgi:hypothetical protein